MPYITNVYYENCGYQRIHGNIEFTKTSQPFYKFTVFLDQPLTYGKCLFMIDQHVIDAQSSDCLESLHIIFTTRELINIHGKIQLKHVYFSGDTVVNDVIDSYSYYSYYPYIESSSPSTLSIPTSITLSGQGFEKNSYLLFLTPTLRNMDGTCVIHNEPIETSCEPCESETLTTKTHNTFYAKYMIPLEYDQCSISTITFSVSKSLLDILGCDLLYMVMISPSTPFPSCNIFTSTCIHNIPSMLYPYSLQKLKIAPYISHICNEMTSSNTIVAGKYNSLVVTGGNFIQHNTSVQIYGKNVANQPENIDVTYIDHSTLKLTIPPIHIFRTYCIRITISYYKYNQHYYSVTSDEDESHQLFVLPEITYISNAVDMNNHCTLYSLQDPYCILYTSNTFVEPPAPPGFLLYYRVDGISYKIGYTILHNTNRMIANNLTIHTDYESFLANMQRKLQYEPDDIVIDVYIQILYPINSQLLPYYSNHKTILLHHTTPHIQTGTCIDHCDDILYQKNRVAICIDAAFDFAKNNTYFKSIDRFQTQSEVTRSFFTIASQECFFQLTGKLPPKSSSYRILPHYDYPIPFESQHDDLLTESMKLHIAQRMSSYDNECNYGDIYINALLALCLHVLQVMIFSDPHGYSPMIQYELPYSLNATANVITSISDTISTYSLTYTLSPVIDASGKYQIPIAQDLNNLMDDVLSGTSSDTDINALKDKLADSITHWVNTTPFLLISDDGKYKGSSYMALVSELYMHYIQTINSALIGNPNVNIISDVETIRTSILEGLQNDNTSISLGHQFIEGMIQNASVIFNALIRIDPLRKPTNLHRINTPVLFKSLDILMTDITISGTIDNVITQVNLTKIFRKNIDPSENNSHSFKEYILNHTGSRIKSITYTILMPLST